MVKGYFSSSRAAALILIIMLNGCSYRQWVATPYPRWGEEVRLRRGTDDTPLILRTWRPEHRERVEACVLLVHGMNEYSGRYHPIARQLARRFLVAGFDLYAHGLSNPHLEAADRSISAGERTFDVSDAFLFQAPLSDLGPMRRDFDLALRRLLLECGSQSLPVFIVSHSLGSLVASSYLLNEWHQKELRERIRGIVLLGPAFSVSQVPGWFGRVANPVIRWSFIAEEWRAGQGKGTPGAVVKSLWALPSSVFLNGLFEALSWPALRQVFTPVTPDWVVNYLTDWEEERVRHRADGYIIRRTLLRYVKGVEREIAQFRQRMRNFDVPYIVFYSAEDPITPAWGVRDFLAATQDRHPDNAVLYLRDKSHHEHLFSAPPLDREILQRIEAWIDQRLQPDAARRD